MLRLSSTILFAGLLLFCVSDGSAAEMGAVRYHPFIDSLFSPWSNSNSPGAAVIVIHGGEIVFSKGYGMASLEHKVPISPQTVFNVASLAKQFTATCVALLAEDGTISLDDSFRKYFPEFGEHCSAITLRDLIHHTSGMRDYFSLWFFSGKEIEDSILKEEVLDVLKRQKALNFKPRESYSYSNSGYFLLAELVRRVTGLPLAEYAERNIFKPLGMKNTRLEQDGAEIVENLAISYRRKSDSTLSVVHLKSGLMGDGGLLTTVEDMVRWDQNFYNNRLGNEKFRLIDTLTTSLRLSTGRETGYAFGMNIGEQSGMRAILHGGTMGGYRSFYRRFPDQNFSVIVLCNLEEMSPFRLSAQIADYFLEGDELTEQVPMNQSRNATENEGPTTTQKPRSPIVEFVGSYYSDELNSTINVLAEKEQLTMKIGYRFELKPSFVHDDVFRGDGAEWSFVRDNRGRITGVNASTGRTKNLFFAKKHTAATRE